MLGRKNKREEYLLPYFWRWLGIVEEAYSAHPTVGLTHGVGADSNRAKERHEEGKANRPLWPV